MTKRAWLTSGAATALAAASLGLAGCGGSDESSITISDQWARTSATSQTRGAAYMNITGGSEDDRLVGASVSPDVAADAQVHETVMAEGSESDMGVTDMTDTDMYTTEESTEDTGDDMSGEMTMREVEEIEIPAGETVKLEPGGYHVMLMDLVAPLEEGSTFELTLEFENAGEQVVEVTVKTA